MRPETPWWDPGADSSVSPETDAIVIDGVRVARGSRVRLRPGARRTDAQDLFLRGRTATVEAVLFDVDGQQHLGVTPDDDAELAEIQRWHGRYLYFAPDEVEPLEPSTAGESMTRTLVAGVGNIFLSDDGVRRRGRAAAGRTRSPEGVEVVDFGIRACTSPTSCSTATTCWCWSTPHRAGGRRARSSLLEVDPADQIGERRGRGNVPLLDVHGMEPASILAMLGSLGGRVHAGRSSSPASPSRWRRASGSARSSKPSSPAGRLVEQVIRRARVRRRRSRADERLIEGHPRGAWSGSSVVNAPDIKRYLEIARMCAGVVSCVRIGRSVTARHAPATSVEGADVRVGDRGRARRSGRGGRGVVQGSASARSSTRSPVQLGLSGSVANTGDGVVARSRVGSMRSLVRAARPHRRTDARAGGRRRRRDRRAARRHRVRHRRLRVGAGRTLVSPTSRRVRDCLAELADPRTGATGTRSSAAPTADRGSRSCATCPTTGRRRRWRSCRCATVRRAVRRSRRQAVPRADRGLPVVRADAHAALGP